MATQIQVLAVKADAHGDVVPCARSQATDIAVYVGEPGAFRHIRDFPTWYTTKDIRPFAYMAAMELAATLACRHACHVVDETTRYGL